MASTATRSNGFDPESVFAEILNPASDGKRYPLFSLLREHAPVFQTNLPGLQGWYVVSNYEYAHQLTNNPKTQNNSKVLELMNLSPDGAYSNQSRRWMEYKDDIAEHDRIRRLFMPHFTPRAVEAFRPKVRELVAELLNGVADPRRVEIVREFAFPLPSAVIGSLLGIELKDYDRFRHCMEAILDATANVRVLSDAERKERDDLAEEFLGMFRDYIAMRRRNPKDDLISKFASEDIQAKISEEDLLAQFVFILIAGYSTTSDMIGNAVVALAHNPDQLKKILDDPNRIPNAITELLRYDTSLVMSTRFVNEPITLGNTTLPAGACVMILLAAAHHDPAAFENPETLDLDRTFGKRVFPFGGGRYVCLGMSLARIELEEALRAFFKRYPRYQVDELAWLGLLVSHGPKKLVISATA